MARRKCYNNVILTTMKSVATALPVFNRFEMQLKCAGSQMVNVRQKCVRHVNTNRREK